ncbi:MAG: hypothetical protein JOZ14_02595 [Acidobacteria bacterium]|nr:hypothetical protein [Acidobacteriota bacterium]
MKCVEFESVLPDYLEGSHSAEQQAHVRSCPACSSLLDDLKLISAQAKLLLASDDPSPAVWNALEGKLRREGLIRRPESPRPGFLLRWRTAWLVPVAAGLLIAAGLKLRHPMNAGDTQPPARPAPAAVAKPMSSEDQQLLTSVGSHVPAQRARYRANLDDANSFIRDAEQSARDYPNDIYTQQMLMSAYEQKQMLYDLAVERTAPEMGEQ